VTEHVVARLEELPPGSHRVVRVGRREIGVFNIDGRLYGLPNLCPHQLGPLCAAQRLTGTLACEPDADGTWRLGWVSDGEIVQCPWHGLEYHVPTGRCLAYPEVVLRRFDVVAEDGLVKVLI
jgi:nitrite reductase/ring-hydroxylating ferredoxin subunit